MEKDEIIRKKMKQKRKNNQGATLAELLIATLIFGFLTMILLGIINFGTRAWKTVESRSTAEKEVRRALLDLSKSIRNTDIRTFNYGVTDTGSAGPVPWIAFKTAQKDDLSDPETINFDGSKVGTERIKWTYFILYYLIKPPGDLCFPETKNSNEYYCPHKWLIKKFLKISTAGGPGDTGIYDTFSGSRTYLTENEAKLYLTQSDSVNTVSAAEKAIDKSITGTVRQVCKNVLVFSTNFYDPYTVPNRGDSGISVPEVQFSVKCFKVMEFASTGAIGKRNLNDSSGAIPTTMSVQVDQKIIPANSNYNNL